MFGRHGRPKEAFFKSGQICRVDWRTSPCNDTKSAIYLPGEMFIKRIHNVCKMQYMHTPVWRQMQDIEKTSSRIEKNGRIGKTSRYVKSISSWLTTGVQISQNVGLLNTRLPNVVLYDCVFDPVCSTIPSANKWRLREKLWTNKTLWNVIFNPT